MSSMESVASFSSHFFSNQQDLNKIKACYCISVVCVHSLWFFKRWPIYFNSLPFVCQDNADELKMKLKNALREKADVFSGGGELQDSVRLGEPGWRERYYQDKFEVKTPEEMEKIQRDVVCCLSNLILNCTCSLRNYSLVLTKLLVAITLMIWCLYYLLFCSLCRLSGWEL